MDSKKVKFTKSLKWQMDRFVLLTSVVVIAVMIAIATPTIEQSLSNITSDYILDLASSKGEMLSRAIEAAGDNNKIFTESAEDMLKDCKVKDMPSSYAYLVDVMAR